MEARRHFCVICRACSFGSGKDRRNKRQWRRASHSKDRTNSHGQRPPVHRGRRLNPCRPVKVQPPPPTAADAVLLDEVIGYLNFSSGTPDPKFLANLNELFRSIEGQVDRDDVLEGLGDWLRQALHRLEQGGGAFSDVSQARAAIALLTEKLPKAYCEFHRDLLHHQSPAELWRPFFIGCAAEAVLSQGPPWNETERIIDRAVASLNDYVGYRPTATLESGARSEPYAHEFVRPIPLYIRGAGVAVGRYERLISRALEILRGAEPDILSRAWFDLNRLEEISLDPRAYDFDHPVNRRPNYHFGQWDPLQISPQGYYSRFVFAASHARRAADAL
jgi:hypothetical protein